MKKLVFLCLICITCMLRAQNVIDNPGFKFRSGSIFNISRIERTPEETRVHVHVIFRPHWWVSLGKKTHLEDADTGEKYYITGSEGFELEKEVYTPDSGTLDFVLLFPPLPETTRMIHFLDGEEEDESHTYFISLEKKKAKALLFDRISGNWMGTDDCYEWAFGIYDSLAVVDNRFYRYESIRQKGKRMLLTLKGDRGDRMELELTPQKDGLCRIKRDGAAARLYSREAASMKAARTSGSEGPVFRRDTVCVQGYIDGYDRRLGFTNGLIYVSNDLTREDYPMVVNLHPDGRFECKFAICYPVASAVVFGNNSIPFYVEPGQTVTMYVDWEAVMARSRARDYYYPLRNVHYMGETACLGKALKYLDELFVFRYEDFSKMQKELTPARFKEHCQPMFRRWEEQADSLIAANGYTGKDARLLRNKVWLLQGGKMFDFAMDRRYMALQDKENEVLRVNEDAAYYDFLRQMPLDDSLMVADRNFSTFINRLEYMNFARAMGNTTNSEEEKIRYTYPKKPFLTYLKEHGVALTPEQEEVRRSHEKNAGKTVNREVSEFIAESKVYGELLEKHKDLFEAYAKEFMNKPDASLAVSEEEKKEKERISKVNFSFERIRKKLGQLDIIIGHTPWVAQVIALRNLPFDLKQQDAEGARLLWDKEKQFITHPFLLSEAERLYVEAFPQQGDSTYALPEGPATEIFRNIIRNHPGKALFVDFWATTCGPCRRGIEQTAGLRKQYKDHPGFQFIYITADRESPEKSYNAYVEKNLEGEACYRIPQADYNHLRQLFRFNGIPHYEWIEKDGTVLRNPPHTYNLEMFLKQRFGEEEVTSLKEKD